MVASPCLEEVCSNAVFLGMSHLPYTEQRVAISATEGMKEPKIYVLQLIVGLTFFLLTNDGRPLLELLIRAYIHCVSKT